MSNPMLWDGGEPPAPVRMTFWGWVRVALRALGIASMVFGGLVVLLAIRLVERPLCGLNRPVTPHITRWVCWATLWVMGMNVETRGEPMRQGGAVVANHTSWLDIFVLNARKRIYFVSKSEVARWPGIGWLARATGTVFIDRDPAQAKAQTELFERRLLAGHKLLFFPEGTSTDGQQVLPFKTTLFAAFMGPELREEISLQPVSVSYYAPPGYEYRFYGWWGDMGFGPHLALCLSPERQGRVVVEYHTPLKVADFANRKALAKAAEDAVRRGHLRDLQGELGGKGSGGR